VIFNDRTANREPHAHATRLGSEEGGEQPVDIFWVEPNAGVLNRNEHMIGVMRPRADHKLAGQFSSVGDGFDTIEVCVGYKLDGKEIDYLPAGEGAQARIEPIYETIEGWKEPTANARSWADLPAQAIKYVRRIEELVGCPIALLSTSPEREDTILVQNPFEA